jgi:hypothetical protein
LLEHTRRRSHGWPVLLSLVVAMGAGCGDDTAVTSEGPMGTTSTGTDSSPITFSMDSTGSTTVVADDTASGGTTSTGSTDSTSSTGPTVDDTTTTSDDTTTTGGEVAPGQTLNQLVTAGERSTSPNFTLVYTFGQPSSLQSTHQSTNYSIQGGLIGANGSPP